MMPNPTEQLQRLLRTEQLDTLLFRGDTPSQNTLPTAYGGQIMAQAVDAAIRTVPKGRMMHSLHAYFLRSGDVKHPILFDVHPVRDGGSFTTRGVIAKQNDEAIFNMSASFKCSEQGLEHGYEMPEVPEPETLLSDAERYQEARKKIPALRAPNQADVFQCFDIRTVAEFASLPLDMQSSTQGYWFKLKHRLEADPSMHQAVLAYISDLRFLRPSYTAHGFKEFSEAAQRLILVSLDHSLWIHSPFDINDWHYFHTNSPVSASGSGLNFGRFYNRSGRMVASCAQENLMRLKQSVSKHL